MTDALTIYTIGHSNYSLERFVELLQMNNITAIADVRSQPHSHYVPHFNRESIQHELNQRAIQYAYLGKELGARWNNPKLYASDGRIDFNLVAQEPLFKKGIARILQGAEKYRLALMCAEKEPLDCHRTHLIARHLAKEQDQAVNIVHILEQGDTIEHVDLLMSCSNAQNDLFRSADDVVTDTFGTKIAYRKR